jgi:hypothetical protein
MHCWRKRYAQALPARSVCLRRSLPLGLALPLALPVVGVALPLAIVWGKQPTQQLK